MLKIRLRRTGARKRPSYRVVVAEATAPRDGRYIEIIGHYQPRQEPSGFDIEEEKVLAWLQKGAQPTEQVHKLLVGAGIWETYESGRSSQSTAAKVAERKAKGQAAAQAEAAKAKAAAEAEAKAAEAKAAAEARLAVQEKRLAALEQEIASIRAGIKEEAESEKARLIAIAEERAKRIKDETSFLLQQQVKEAELQLRHEAGKAAVDMAEQLVRKSMGPADQQRMLDAFVGDVATPPRKVI